MKLQLPSVTLCCIDCVDPDRAFKIVSNCAAMADFGDVKLLTDRPNVATQIPKLSTLVMYSIFMLTKLHHYINTPHVLIVQRDGWILNPDSFDPAWLELDYIGPLFVQYDKVGSGGFSLRSKKIMADIADTLPYWDGTEDSANKMQSELNYYEDGVICLSKFGKQYKIATNEQAAKFAQGGNRNPKYFNNKPFGFHRTWQEIDFKTGRVDSSDTSKDLHISYEHEIDEL